jgi:phosphoribosylaminoimidazole carboxylase PurE protein
MSQKKVLILMGSDSDLKVMEEAVKALDKFGIASEVHIASAHRTPTKVEKLAGQARADGFGVIIAGAGMSAHLGGVVAANTTLPVIGVPMAAGALQGVDALLSISQMPRGIPVATVTVGPAGAYNAGLLAAAILAVDDEALAKKLDGFRQEMAKKVEEKDAGLKR